MDKKLLVLGIGPAQVDLIEAAKEMGIEVHAIAKTNKGPGYDLVDKFETIDIKDEEKITEYAKNNHIDFIYTMALEAAVPVISRVSNKLNLPNFCSVESLNKFTSKAVWRQALGDIDGNVKSQKGSKLTDFEDWDIFPAILKPVDGSGQRGVHKINDFSELKNIFDESISHSKVGELIIEDYVDGPEISVNSFMEKGELKVAFVSDRISYDEYPGGIIKEHHLPSRIIDQKLEDRIIKLVNTVNEKMGFTDGHIYHQLKIQNNDPYLIEFTPRFDACHMWRLIKESTGLDLRKAALELLSNGTSKSINEYNDDKVEKVKTFFISDKPGTEVRYDDYQIPNDPLYLQWYYEEGSTVKSVTGYIEKVGYYIISE